MTKRLLLDPNSLDAAPSVEDLRQVAVDLWAINFPDYTVETEDYTTKLPPFRQYILVDSPGNRTVKLHDKATDGQEVTVHRVGTGAVDIEVDGAKLIFLGNELHDCVTLQNQDDAVTFKWFDDLDQWMIVGG